MAKVCFCGWRPLITRTIFAGILLSSAFAIGYANDKASRQQQRSSASAPERTAHVERQSSNQGGGVANRSSNQSQNQSPNQGFRATSQPQNVPANGGANRHFNPQFGNGLQRVQTQPNAVNVPSNRSQFGGVNSAGAGSMVYLQKRDEQKREEKPNDREKPPKVQPPRQQPQEVRPDRPKPVKPSPDAPKVIIPKIEQPKIQKPMPEVKIKPEPRAKPEVRQNENKPQPNTSNNRGEQGQRTDIPQVRIKKPTEKPEIGRNSGSPKSTDPSSKIRIKKPETAGENIGSRSEPGRIRIKTPQPDQNLDRGSDKNGVQDLGKSIRPKDKNNPIDNNVGKSVAKNAAKNAEKSVRLKDGATLPRAHHQQVKLDLDKQHRELISKGKATEHAKVKLAPQIKVAGTERLKKLPREALKLPVPKNGKLDPSVAAKLKLQPAREVLRTRIQKGDLQHLANVKSGKSFQLNKQFQLHQQGDVSRRMNLLAGLHLRGGWRNRFYGPISPIYPSHCMAMWYAGPSFCSPYLWYPTWSPWVDWCWWDTCAPLYDPRPIVCHPVVYDPCGPWVTWDFPTWSPLPYVACGTWVDVEPVVIDSGVDLQLLATRFVDPGHPDQELGPRFRVWVRNNSPVDLNREFNVMLIASTDANAYAGLPEAGVRVLGLGAGETQAVDIRLPYAANIMGRDSSGRAIPFTHLTALADSHNELPEAFEANNGATLVRGDILPVDPVAFAADPSFSQPNGIIHLAGEGLGPEPGQAMVVIGDQEFQAEILGWFDLGVQIRLPDFELDAATAADIVIIRGDGAASNPLTIEIDPSGAVPEVALAPEPELPEPPALPEPAF